MGRDTIAVMTIAIGRANQKERFSLMTSNVEE
jgi:hypothetical protein